MAEDQEKLSPKLGLIADIIREANFWATQDNNDIIKKKHVQKALDEKIYRWNLIQVRIEEMIELGTILIDTDSAKVGHVNGPFVVDLGDYQFGRPNRITATLAPGRDGIVDIEREVKLGGPIHSKGILILSGYLLKKYSLGKPITLAARPVFEQTYQGIEGDIASAAELFAVISALSEVPPKQSIAVTGSVNQQGEIQSIGGINQKIEESYDVCKAMQFNGNQGVVIPKSNITNLLLRDDVIESAESGGFHVWAVESIDQGIEVLTGLKASKLKSDGTFTRNSFNEHVRQRLDRFEKAFPKSTESK